VSKRGSREGRRRVPLRSHQSNPAVSGGNGVLPNRSALTQYVYGSRMHDITASSSSIFACICTISSVFYGKFGQTHGHLEPGRWHFAVREERGVVGVGLCRTYGRTTRAPIDEHLGCPARPSTGPGWSRQGTVCRRLGFAPGHFPCQASLMSLIF